MILIYYTTSMLPFYLYAKAISIFLTKHNLENKMVYFKKFKFEQVKKSDIIICWLPYFQKILYDIIKDRINELKIIIINSEPQNNNNRYHKLITDIDCKNMFFWDYTTININLLSKINKFNHIVSPFTYHPYFEEHFKENSDDIKTKDIDFLLLGGNKCSRRKYIQAQLEQNYNYVTLYDCKRYKNLYNTIKRSKIIVLIRYYEYDDCIDFYRLSYLLSNKAFVIHEMTTDPSINDFNKIIYSSYDNFINTCEEWINKSQDERDAKVNEIYDWWKANHHMDKYIPLSEINKFINS